MCDMVVDQKYKLVSRNAYANAYPYKFRNFSNFLILDSTTKLSSRY